MSYRVFCQVPPGYNPGHQYRLRIEGYSRWPFLLVLIRNGKWQKQTHANLSSCDQLEFWLDTNLQTRWCNDFQQRDCPWVQVLMFPVQLLFSLFLFSCRKITRSPQMLCWRKTIDIECSRIPQPEVSLHHDLHKQSGLHSHSYHQGRSKYLDLNIKKSG